MAKAKLKVLKTSATVNGHTKRELRTLLKRMDEGKISDFALICVDQDRGICWQYDTRDALRLIGQLELLKAGIVESKRAQ